MLFCIVSLKTDVIFNVILSALVIKRVNIDVPMKYVFNVIYCCWCCRSAKAKSRVVQTMGLCSILAFIQLFAFFAVPVTLVTILHPSENFSIVFLFLSVFVCTIMVVSHLFYAILTGSKSCIPILVQVLVIFALVGLMCSVIVFYLLLLQAGLTLGSTWSFLASLIPSVIISAGAWYVKTKLLAASPSKAQFEDLVEAPEARDKLIANGDNPGWEPCINTGAEHAPLLRD